MARRVSWKCPDCGRRFRIPADTHAPASCPKCAGNGRAVKEGIATEEEIEFDEAPAASKPRFSVSVTRSGRPSEPARPIGSRESAEKNADRPGSQLDRQDEILDRLNEMNRSMKFFRRLVWGMLIAAALNALIMGIGLIYSMRMMGAIGGLFSSVTAAGEGGGAVKIGDLQNVEGIPAQTREQLKIIQEYSRTMNELLKEP